MNKDYDQKSKLFTYFIKQSCFAQAEVEVVPRRATSPGVRALTDIDLLVYRPHPDLYFERIFCDCKSGKRVTPIERAFWLKGLMEYLGGDRGLVLLKRESEPDHRRAAEELGITLLSESHLQEYMDSLPGGVPGYDDSTLSLDDHTKMLMEVSKRYKKLDELISFLRRGFWQLDSFDKQIRLTIKEVRQARDELNPQKTAHSALILEACALLAIGFAECTSLLFKSHLKPSDGKEMANALSLLVWGGRERANMLAQLSTVLRNKGNEGASEDLLLFPAFPTFERVVRESLDRPRACFYTPWLLRHAAVDTSQGRAVLLNASKKSETGVKLAFELADYLIKAADLPTAFFQTVSEPLVQRLVELDDE